MELSLFYFAFILLTLLSIADPTEVSKLSRKKKVNIIIIV